jgi:hypothetical protein
MKLPRVTGDKVVRALKRAGFVETLKSILRQADMSAEELKVKSFSEWLC